MKLHRDFRRTTPAELDAIGRSVALLSAKRLRRAEAAANIVFAVVLGLLGALLLWHWLSPCDAASLCMGVVGMPRRRPYIPAGCDQQGRQPAGRGAMTHEELRAWPWGELSLTGPLTEAELDRHNREQHPSARMGELLLSGGAVTRHRGRSLLERLQRAWREWRAGRTARRIARLGPRL